MTSAMQPRDKWIPWYFVMFFVGLAVIDGTMVTIAIRTQTGLVTEHPYEKGLAYNQVVAAEEKQKQLGWKGQLIYANGVLRFTLHDKNNQRIIPKKSTVSITRPTQAGMDFTVELQGEETRITFPLKGLWEVRVDALHEGVDYQQTKRIVVE